MGVKAFFTVTAITKKGPVHYLVRAESALEALVCVRDTEKVPVVAVHATEYTKYIDAEVVQTVKTEEAVIVSDDKKEEKGSENVESN